MSKNERRIKLQHPKISEIVLRNDRYGWGGYVINILLYNIRRDGEKRRRPHLILNISSDDGLTLQYIYMSNLLDLDVEENNNTGYPSRRLVMDNIDML